MKANKKKTYFTIAAFTLGLHYLVILLAWLLNKNGQPFYAVFSMMYERLATAGDSPRYLDIAQHGYVTQGENAINLVFYPLYPLFIHLGSVLTGAPALTGMIISQISYAAASILLYELILLDGNSRMAWDGVVWMAVYPFSIFVMGVFSEGLFLFLTIACLYAIRTEKWLAAGVTGFLAALCRTQGMLLIFPAAYEAVEGLIRNKREKFQKKKLFITLIPCGFLVYLLINYALYGNFFQFLIFEKGEPWYQTTQWIGNNLTLHYQMAKDYEGLALIIYWVQLALYFLVLAVLFLGVIRKERIAYLLYGGVYLGFSYLSGWMISGGRYMLGCIPVFIILAKMKLGIPRLILLLLGSLLFFTYSLLYMMGYAIM